MLPNSTKTPRQLQGYWARAFFPSAFYFAPGPGREMEETGFKCDMKVVGASAKTLSALKPPSTSEHAAQGNDGPVKVVRYPG